MLNLNLRSHSPQKTSAMKVVGSMSDINPAMSTITSNENVLNTPFKKYNSIIYCLQKYYFNYKDSHSLKVKGWRKTNHANSE